MKQTKEQQQVAAWILLVNATSLRANAQCEDEPLAAFMKACEDRQRALAELRALGVDLSGIEERDGLWPVR